jgi:hypothetical protein
MKFGNINNAEGNATQMSANHTHVKKKSQLEWLLVNPHGAARLQMFI